MQFKGIGQEHNQGMHHVTTCIHDHSHYKKTEGELPGGAASAARPQAAHPAEQRQEGGLSLSAWLERTLGRGRSLLQGFWGSSEMPGAGEAGNTTGEAQVLAQLNTDSASERGSIPGSGINSLDETAAAQPHTPQIAAASAPLRELQNNPYFQTLQEGSQSGSMLQKIRVKFKDIKGQLAGHLPGRFFSSGKKGSFQTGKETPREDLRRHSRYRKDELEIDCILTDDSYLLDSYDRKGEYSRLSARGR